MYTCRCWSHHLTPLSIQGGVYASLLDYMQEICSKSLLYWIEAAGILDDVDKAIIVLRDALNWLKVCLHLFLASRLCLNSIRRLLPFRKRQRRGSRTPNGRCYLNLLY